MSLVYTRQEILQFFIGVNWQDLQEEFETFAKRIFITSDIRHLASGVLLQKKNILSSQFLYDLLDLFPVGSRHLLDLLAILEENECRHGGNPVLGCQLFSLITVYLEPVFYFDKPYVLRKADLSHLDEKNFLLKLCREAVKDWMHDLTGSTPRSIEIDDHHLPLFRRFI